VEAAAWGLLDALEPEDQVEARVFAQADEIAGNAPLAVRGMRRIFNVLTEPSLDPGVAGELHELRRQAFASDDAREGRAAFLEKRCPVFRGS
jgi:enoyl-CoA hydratase/carnithine racemase